MLPILQGSLITVGPWFSTHGRKGLRVYPFQRGGTVKTASTSTSITLHDSGDIAANDYVLVCSAGSYGEDNVWAPALSKVALVTDVTSDVLTISGSGLTVAVGDYCLCLGADTGGTSPNFDGSDITLYEDPVGTTEGADYLVTGSSSGFIGWVNRGAIECDVLVTDSSNVPLSVEIAKPVTLQRMGYAYRGTRPTLTIDTGSVTLPDDQEATEVIIAAESGTTDSLDNILGGLAGDILFLSADSGDTITVTEDGNISLESTVAMTGDLILVLRYDGTTWDQVSFTQAGSATPTTATLQTMTLLDETTENGTNVAYTLAIASGYDSIRVEAVTATDTAAAAVASPVFHINADTTITNYHSQYFWTVNGASTDAEANTNNLIACSTQASSPGWAYMTVDIGDPDATRTKMARAVATSESGTDVTNSVIATVHWDGTAAITNITFTAPGGANWKTGSVWRVYGIKDQLVTLG